MPLTPGDRLGAFEIVGLLGSGGMGQVYAGKGILRVSLNGGTPEVIVATAEDETAADPQLLPGGRTVLYSIKKVSEVWDRAKVVVQSLDDGTKKRSSMAELMAVMCPLDTWQRVPLG